MRSASAAVLRLVCPFIIAVALMFAIAFHYKAELKDARIENWDLRAENSKAWAAYANQWDKEQETLRQFHWNASQATLTIDSLRSLLNHRGLC